MVHSSALLPQWHPATHGGINIDYTSIDGRIDVARIEIGLMHRGAEKLLEVRDYRQGAALANRHIWSSPTAGEYAFVLAAEELLGLIVSPRADAHRAIYCEIDRIISHLTFLCFLGPLPVREAWANFMERATGARMHHQVIRIGGVAFGLEAPQLDEIEKLMAQTEIEVGGLTVVGEGVGLLSPDVAAQHGVTGPIARASGINFDERCTGYGWYSNFQPVRESGGDAAARFRTLIAEVVQSMALIRSAISSVGGDDELLVRTPKTIRLPEGETYVAVEGALGSNGVALFSTGAKAPDRVRIRSASLGNLSALESVLSGVDERDLGLLLASWPFLAGDSDR